MDFFKKPYKFAIIYTVFLILLSVFILLDTFIIPRKYSNTESFMTADFSFSTAPVEDKDLFSTSLETKPVISEETSIQKQENVISDSLYTDENISISLKNIRYENTDIHVADVKVSSPEYLKTAIAKNTFGTNITEKTSAMAENNGAILAINGDFYGANKKGYVIKNGTLYRKSVRSDDEYDDLAILYDGSFEIFNENDVSAEDLLENGVYQLFGFGPVLINGGKITVNAGEEVGRAMSSNPRTAIGILDDLHYIFLVSDGRTSNNDGLSLYELAQFMKDIGCTVAYNLDGGGSSTMYFNGKIVNTPVSSSKKNKSSERSVSDIVYIGY